MSNSSDSTPRLTPIVAGYVGSLYFSASVRELSDPAVCLISSQDIQLALSEMADLDLNDIATSMVALGFEAACSGGKPGWIVRPKH